ncbi:hypothetical protein RvY_14680 [Ramazzottius varieornatus]|uniref:Uncharacterized protein n=1 Tax=Ramazzottius varieornatus TaxID=947166 RepID=A0A1D1VU09_RAMVA|nr:hypothetical protein RvY_14680 [Ramazzottius varieornatus]
MVLLELPSGHLGLGDYRREEGQGKVIDTGNGQSSYKGRKDNDKEKGEKWAGKSERLDIGSTGDEQSSQRRKLNFSEEATGGQRSLPSGNGQTFGLRFVSSTGTPSRAHFAPGFSKSRSTKGRFEPEKRVCGAIVDGDA